VGLQGRLAGLQRGRAGCAQGAGSGAAVERAVRERRERERCREAAACGMRCVPYCDLEKTIGGPYTSLREEREYVHTSLA
jgi:hypothetical protein